MISSRFTQQNEDNRILALKEGLVTPAQIERMYHSAFLEHLFSENGMIALREKLITSDEAMRIPHPVALRYLFSENGMIALRNGLIYLEIDTEEAIYNPLLSLSEITPRSIEAILLKHEIPLAESNEEKPKPIPSAGQIDESKELLQVLIKTLMEAKKSKLNGEIIEFSFSDTDLNDAKNLQNCLMKNGFDNPSSPGDDRKIFPNSTGGFIVKLNEDEFKRLFDVSYSKMLAYSDITEEILLSEVSFQPSAPLPRQPKASSSSQYLHQQATPASSSTTSVKQTYPNKIYDQTGLNSDIADAIAFYQDILNQMRVDVSKYEGLAHFYKEALISDLQLSIDMISDRVLMAENRENAKKAFVELCIERDAGVEDSYLSFISSDRYFNACSLFQDVLDIFFPEMSNFYARMAILMPSVKVIRFPEQKGTGADEVILGAGVLISEADKRIELQNFSADGSFHYIVVHEGEAFDLRSLPTEAEALINFLLHLHNNHFGIFNKLKSHNLFFKNLLVDIEKLYINKGNTKPIDAVSTLICAVKEDIDAGKSESVQAACLDFINYCNELPKNLQYQVISYTERYGSGRGSLSLFSERLVAKPARFVFDMAVEVKKMNRFQDEHRINAMYTRPDLPGSDQEMLKKRVKKDIARMPDNSKLAGMLTNTCLSRESYNLKLPSNILRMLLQKEIFSSFDWNDFAKLMSNIHANLYKEILPLKAFDVPLRTWFLTFAGWHVEDVTAYMTSEQEKQFYSHLLYGGIVNNQNKMYPLLSALPEDERLPFLREIIALYPDYIYKNPNNYLCDVRMLLPLETRVEFTKDMIEKFPQILFGKDSESFRMLMLFIGEHHLEFAKWILTNNPTKISDANSLKEGLEVIPYSDTRAFAMWVVERNDAIIKNVEDLATSIVNLSNNKERLEFVKWISERNPGMIKTLNDIENIVKELPFDEEPQALAKLLLKHLIGVKMLWASFWSANDSVVPSTSGNLRNNFNQ